MAADFTVVMAVYAGDKPAFLLEAFESLRRQTLPPAEILIVVDGPIGKELNELVDGMAVSSGVAVLRLPENRGPGAARDAAIRSAKHGIIAIMDADDICDVRRFERQIPVIVHGKAAIVGGWIEEFDRRPGDLRRIRKVPETHDAIFSYGKWRQPLNHVTAVFERDAYFMAGGYAPIRHVEDWDLLHRMLLNGVRFYNVPEILVHVRCGAAMMSRRAGVGHLSEELHLFRKMYGSNYLNIFQLLGNVSVRLASRLLPRSLLALVYDKCLRRTHGELVP